MFHIKIKTIDDLIKAKDRDKVRGMIEAEIDFTGITTTYENDFTALYAYMKDKALDGESILFARLLKTTDLREEQRIISQVKHFRKLHKQFMLYARKQEGNQPPDDTGPLPGEEEGEQVPSPP